MKELYAVFHPAWTAGDQDVELTMTISTFLTWRKIVTGLPMFSTSTPAGTQPARWQGGLDGLQLRELLKNVPATGVMAIGNHGYDWIVADPKAATDLRRIKSRNSSSRKRTGKSQCLRPIV